MRAPIPQRPMPIALGLLLTTSACVLTFPETRARTSQQTAPAPNAARRVDHEALNAELIRKLRADLAAAGDDLEKLSAVRREVLSHAATQRYPNTHFSDEADLNRRRRTALWSVLRPLQLKRVDLYLAKGQPTEALREILATGMGDRSVLSMCAFEDEPCRARLKRLDAAFPGFCLGFEGKSCGLLGTSQHELSALNDRRKMGQTIDTTVLDVKRVGSELLVSTTRIPSHDWKECQGRFETDKIKEVRADAIVVERTTWCREITQRHDQGVLVQYRLPAGTREPPRGALVRLYMNVADQKTSGTVTTFHGARLIAFRSGLTSPTVYVGNEDLDYQQAVLLGLSAPSWTVR
jgi:hypothetical protein